MNKDKNNKRKKNNTYVSYSKYHSAGKWAQYELFLFLVQFRKADDSMSFEKVHCHYFRVSLFILMYHKLKKCLPSIIIITGNTIPHEYHTRKDLGREKGLQVSKKEGKKRRVNV